MTAHAPHPYACDRETIPAKVKASAGNGLDRLRRHGTHFHTQKVFSRGSVARHPGDRQYGTAYLILIYRKMPAIPAKPALLRPPLDLHAQARAQAYRHLLVGASRTRTPGFSTSFPGEPGALAFLIDGSIRSGLNPIGLLTPSSVGTGRVDPSMHEARSTLNRGSQGSGLPDRRLAPRKSIEPDELR